MNLVPSCFAVLILSASIASAAVPPFRVASPGGKVVLSFRVGDNGEPLYSVEYAKKPVVIESRLGLELKGATALDSGLRVTKAVSASHDETWRPVAGERSSIRDHYNQLSLDLEDGQPLPRRLQLTFRVYDEGAAFCYTVPDQLALRNFTIASELTEFRFADNHPCWAVYSAQGQYKRVGLDEVKANCERPLTIEIEGGPAVAVGEARLVDYARMRLQPAKDRGHAVKAHLGSEVEGHTPLTTPWRFVMIADTPGQLLERNYLVLNLNDPCAIADTSWIKPGKVIRESTLTTAGGKACVDFAVKMNLQYIEYDAGWYGYEYDPKSDASAVNLDPRRSKGPLDLQEVIRYGDAHGIGVLLYVNHLALEKQIDQLLPLYQKWGVKGIKFGFVNVGPQKWTSWLHESIRKCADFHLMVDVHDEYRPTGLSRTWPHLMTVEGIGGDETMPTADHNATLPFTRFLCGQADHTICWYSDRVKNTRAHQLASAVVFFSPWQFLYWYDKPSMYLGEPELEFWKHAPVVWDDTRVLDGAIGQHVSIARRSGDAWFVGSFNALERRTLKVPLSFLKPDGKYVAQIYKDAAPDGSARTKVTCEERSVDASTVIEADMAANGGHAMRIIPQK